MTPLAASKITAAAAGVSTVTTVLLEPAWGRALMLATYLLAQAGLTKAVIDGEAS